MCKKTTVLLTWHQYVWVADKNQFNSLVFKPIQILIGVALPQRKTRMMKKFRCFLKTKDSGYCIFLGANPILWISRKQHVVSRSATETEYHSVADSIIDLMWVMSLLKEKYIDVIKTPCIWCDNTGTVALASNPVLHSIELDVHFEEKK